MLSVFAESMKAQVFTIRTSASAELEVRSIPAERRCPSMISESTRFFAQPREIRPTLVAMGRRGRGKRASAAGGKAEGLGAGFFVRTKIRIIENDFGIRGFSGGDDKRLSGPGGIVLGWNDIVFVDGIFKKLDLFAVTDSDNTNPGVFLGFDS